MSEKHSQLVNLRPHQRDYLEHVAAKHKLPDVSKAIRILIEFARQNPEHEDRIFTTVRCASGESGGDVSARPCNCPGPPAA